MSAGPPVSPRYRGVMKPDPTYKDIFGYAFMVEELVRWLVGDLHGARELVGALDFATLRRVHEQSVTGDARNLRHHSRATATWCCSSSDTFGTQATVVG